MRDAYLDVPWTLQCPWCPYSIVVFARGQRGGDPGAGVEAAERMQRHVDEAHAATWRQCVDAMKQSA